MKDFGELWPLERFEGRVVLFEKPSLGSASSGRYDDRARLLLVGFSEEDDFLGALMYVMGWSESVGGEDGK